MSESENKQDRTEKLVSLTYALITTRVGYTRAQLREMVDDYAGLSDEAFERKFERDKETLRNLGVVLADARGRGEGQWMPGDVDRRYRILPDEYPLPPLPLEPDEAALLGLAASVVAGGGLGRQAKRAADRLGFDTASLHPILSPTVDAEGELLEPLVRFVALGTPIRFTYTTADGGTSERTVVPWGLGHRHGHWYLAAGDVKRDGERLFRLDRMSGKLAQHAAKAEDYLPEAYGRPEHFSMARELDRLERSEAGKVALLEAELGAGGTLLARATERTHLPDGTVRLRLAYADTQGFASEIAAEGLRVLSPADLAAAVHNQLEAAFASQSAPVPVYKVSGPRGGRVSAELTVSRALDLVSYVVSNGAPSPDQVMQRFGFTRAELDRELTRLRFCGVPNGQHDELLEVEWNDTSITISNAAVLAQPMNLNLAEAASLLMGLDALASAPEGTHSEQSQGSIERLSAKLRALRPELTDFDHIIAVRAASREAGSLVGVLASAIEEHQVLELEYAGGSGDGTRQVEPVRVLDAGGRTYLQAWCRQRNAPRTFRVDRIVGASRSGEGFVPDPEREAQVRSAVFTPAADDVLVDVAWMGDAAAAAASHAPEKVGKIDGGVVTRWRVRDPQYLVRLVSGGGGAVRVIAPEDIRDATTRALASRLAVARDAALTADVGHAAAELDQDQGDEAL